jgi:hypothetical protein
VLKSGEQSVLVGIEHVAPADWVKKVYRPDILDKGASSTGSRTTNLFNSLPMDIDMAWHKGELRKIAACDDLHISPLRVDGKTFGTPTWIWSVVVDDALYVRAYNGRQSRWYQAAVNQKAGRITAAGMTKDVVFEPVGGTINDGIDEAYRAKYRGSPYLNAMIGERARSATVKVALRSDSNSAGD